VPADSGLPGDAGPAPGAATGLLPGRGIRTARAKSPASIRPGAQYGAITARYRDRNGVEIGTEIAIGLVAVNDRPDDQDYDNDNESSPPRWIRRFAP